MALSHYGIVIGGSWRVAGTFSIYHVHAVLFLPFYPEILDRYQGLMHDILSVSECSLGSFYTNRRLNQLNNFVKSHVTSCESQSIFWHESRRCCLILGTRTGKYNLLSLLMVEGSLFGCSFPVNQPLSVCSTDKLWVVTPRNLLNKCYVVSKTLHEWNCWYTSTLSSTPRVQTKTGTGKGSKWKV